MASEWKRQRCRERIDDLADSSADIDALRREAIEILQATIGFDRWCSLLLDPDTLVISQGIGHTSTATGASSLLRQKRKSPHLPRASLATQASSSPTP